METQLVKSGIYSRLFKFCPHTFRERNNIMIIYIYIKKNVNTCICCSAKALKHKLHKIFVLGIGWKVWSSLRFSPPCAPNPSSIAAIFPIPACPLHSSIKGKSVWITNTSTHTHPTYISKFIQRSSTHAERSFSKAFPVTCSLIHSHSKG